MEVHLPCPPLREWLAVLLEGKRAAAWNPRDAPRQVRPLLRGWPLADPGQLELDALLFGVSLERPSPPDSCLAALPGNTLIIELAVPRRRVLRRLLRLGSRPQARAVASQSRVLQWLGRGYFDVEQWETVDPPGVVVTLARTRR
ncbi:MAG TPA: hypothetical protein VK034_13155 [Enhygromyxa sp.]|nr:hypothetical protein [Enhygromyxa sp.]